MLVTASNGPAVLSDDRNRFQRAGPVDDRGRRRDRGSGITSHCFYQGSELVQFGSWRVETGSEREGSVPFSPTAGLPAFRPWLRNLADALSFLCSGNRVGYDVFLIHALAMRRGYRLLAVPAAEFGHGSQY